MHLASERFHTTRHDIIDIILYFFIRYYFNLVTRTQIVTLLLVVHQHADTIHTVSSPPPQSSYKFGNIFE